MKSAHMNTRAALALQRSLECFVAAPNKETYNTLIDTIHAFTTLVGLRPGGIGDDEEEYWNDDLLENPDALYDYWS